MTPQQAVPPNLLQPTPNKWLCCRTWASQPHRSIPRPSIDLIPLQYSSRPRTFLRLEAAPTSRPSVDCRNT